MTLWSGVMNESLLKGYLESLLDVHLQGDAREESFYGALTDLLAAIAGAAGLAKIHVTTLPKKTEAGNPDFRIWDGGQHIVGYIEAKDPSVENLDLAETSEQLKRYLGTFPNLILTNFYEFRLYRQGVRIDAVRIGRPFIARKLRAVPPVERAPECFDLFEKFFAFSVPKVRDAQGLAVELARRTRFLKDAVIAEELRQEEQAGGGTLLDFYNAFGTFLISGLTKDAFADLYAQTIAYGLFAARTRSEDGFNRKLAYDRIPPTIGILRDVFRFISLGDLPRPMEWIIDDIAEVLAVTDVKAILHQYFHEGRGRDPIVHFYETFLSEYDPVARERRGVYYTPEPVVSYITRSVHLILKEHFGRQDGFAGNNVTVLDPAAGTLTFLAEAARLAVVEFATKYGHAGKAAFIREHILRNFFAFELMMAPYAVGHLKMSFLLEELGYRLREEDRFPLYLTNTLDMEDLEQVRLPGLSSLAAESRLAGRVKKEQPVLAILGNPPYSGHSANRGKWITEQIKGAYQKVDGRPLGEKNPKWLQDDYVKFLRFAQWKIDGAGEGVIGFITNHSYLDNPTFRGMRRSLMDSFGEIYLLDLHGNSLKKETCPDGSKDENVFDIRQGVAIALMIKKKQMKKAPCRVFHAERWDLRGEKYEWLNDNHIKTTNWKELSPASPLYLFIPRDVTRQQHYDRFPGIKEIFPVHSVGIVTARDRLTIHWSPVAAWNTVLNFSRLDPELARQAYQLGKDTQDWKVASAQKDLTDSGPTRERVVPILYRPFDTRYTYYTGKPSGFHCRPRFEVMRHMLRENLGLIMQKQFKEQPGAFVTNCVIGHKSVGAFDINYLFPLYLYDGVTTAKKVPALAGVMMLFEPESAFGRVPNLNRTLRDKWAAAYGATPSPEDIFHYIYAVLYANTYRSRYAEFLKTDFPRIPFAGSHEGFRKLAALGRRLTDLHLMRAGDLDPPIARFQGEAGPIKTVRYLESEGRIILDTGYFVEGVAPEVWRCRIGGYQVCEKWLKDRKGRTLTPDDIRHYGRLVTALQKTLEIQEEIDKLYLTLDSC